ncbi:MAG: hypothetical protein IH987_17545 [Planctomycetes bacterium]|nr:hypothetical protein [Planctomycetota bacterium]
MAMASAKRVTGHHLQRFAVKVNPSRRRSWQTGRFVDPYTALTGTKVSVADSDDNKLTTVDVYAPRERYLKCVINRGTANSTLDGIVAEQYDRFEEPTTDDATVSGSETHVSPAEGAA